jgi:hypothetical protein
MTARAYCSIWPAIREVKTSRVKPPPVDSLAFRVGESRRLLARVLAHSVTVGPTPGLGPRCGVAKDLIAAVAHAEKALAANPDSYPLQVALLADFTTVMVQQARSALARSEDLVREALRSNPGRTPEQVEALALALKEKLIDLPQDYGAVFGAKDAEDAGLPVEHADPRGDQWKAVWELWSKYFDLDCFACEGRLASQVSSRGPYAF